MHVYRRRYQPGLLYALQSDHYTDSLFFFFQAEDGIRDYKVTGVQTCALPISRRFGYHRRVEHTLSYGASIVFVVAVAWLFFPGAATFAIRSALRQARIASGLGDRKSVV